jgi:hypothetical protein
MTQGATIRSRLFPSLSDVVFCTTLLLLFLMAEGATSLLKDSDTGWHIRTGQWILQHHAVPRQDLFSFSKPGEPWFAWEWGSDVLFALVHQYAGLAGVALLAGVVIALLYALLYRLMLRQGVNLVVALPLVMLASYAGSIHWLARPHMFSWLFGLLFYWVLLEVPVEQPRVFWLVPLTALWTNLHGSFVLGLVLIAVFAAGEVVRAAVTSGQESGNSRREALGRAGRYGLLLAACAAASLVNPYFFRVHLHIFKYLQDDYILNHIGEFFSPNFRFTPAKFFEVLLVLGGGAAVWAVRRGRYAQALLVVAFTHFSLQSARHIPLYAIFVAPVIGGALTEALEAAKNSVGLSGWLRSTLVGFKKFGDDNRPLDLRPRVYALSVVVTVFTCALVILSTHAGRPKELRAQFNPQQFPVRAADYLALSGPDTDIFTTDQWASYLIYRFYPRVRVFMDGRSDYYGAAVGNLYLNVIGVQYTWEKTLDDYRVRTVLLPASEGLAGAMKESRRWHVDYDDGIAILFSRTAEGPAQLAANRADDRTKEVRPTLNPATASGEAPDRP